MGILELLQTSNLLCLPGYGDVQLYRNSRICSERIPAVMRVVPTMDILGGRMVGCQASRLSSLHTSLKQHPEMLPGAMTPEQVEHELQAGILQDVVVMLFDSLLVLGSLPNTVLFFCSSPLAPFGCRVHLPKPLSRLRKDDLKGLR